MRISSLILPKEGNNGESLADVHGALRATLCDMFGGFTACETFGGWKDGAKVYLEAGWRYDVAIDPCDYPRLDSLARFYGHMGRQLAVMVVHDGASDVITLSAAYDPETAQKSLAIG